MVPAMFLLLLAVVGTCYGQGEADSCNQWESCDECIAMGVGCVWCPDPPPFSGHRCTSNQTADCLSGLENPVAAPPQIVKEEPFGETVQISPQEIRLNLRTGEPQTFTLSVKPARNYPLDMYFLMDLSGSLASDLDSLEDLSNSITDELEQISSQFTLGFGSFVDKITYPFASTLQNGSDYMTNHLGRMVIECANGRASCGPTYVYRHHLPLTNGSGQLREVLEDVTIRGNLDAPEATLEALLQSVVCLDEVGWRNGSLRIVMVLTDAGFKTALDGRIAALVTRNDGECHLEPEEGFYDYSRSHEQDFPSIYQVREKLIENDIITIFAVAEDVVRGRTLTDYVVYRELAEEIGSSRAFVQTIANNSADIVSVIRRAYERVKRDIVVDSVSGLTIGIAPVLNCNLISDGRGCANVTIEQLVSFHVTVTMDKCLKGMQTRFLRLPGYGKVELTLVPICECNCTSQMIANYPSCNYAGSLVCGTCDCSGGSDAVFRDQCECKNPLQRCVDDCFNRGTCNNCSGECTSCFTRQDTIGGAFQIVGSFGERCQCDNSSGAGACPVGRDIDQVCSGRGECKCDGEKCDCDCECGTAPLSGQQYSGDDCGCDPDNCYNEQYPGRVCAHSQDREKDGMCDCNDCQCHTDSVSFNRTCIYKDNLCSLFVSCALCWPMNCSIGDCHPSTLYYLNSDGVSVSCTFERDGCTVDYQVVLSGAFNTMGSVFVGGERDCQDSNILSQLAWIIPVSISGGILLPVLLLLVATTCIRTYKCNNPICTRNSSYTDPSAAVIYETVGDDDSHPDIVVYETVDDVRQQHRVAETGPATRENLAYGVSYRVSTAPNPAYAVVNSNIRPCI